MHIVLSPSFHWTCLGDPGKNGTNGEPGAPGEKGRQFALQSLRFTHSAQI